MARTFKRVLLMGDTHCGHRVGLTPPKYQSAIPGEDYYRTQIEAWGMYKGWIEELKPVDCVFVLGDCIDGTGFTKASTRKD